MKKGLKKIDVNELKRIQLDILNVVVDFCEKNKINYFLNAGTLLGAIRHKGYIPWDDDIDLGMLRPDYNRFINHFNNENTRYKAYCYENNNNFLYPYCKILDTNTLLYEPDKDGNHLSINIDLFVLDNAIENSFKMKVAFLKRNFYRNCFQVKLLYTKRYNLIKKIIIYILYALLLPFSKEIFIKKIVKIENKYNSIKSDYVGDFTGYHDVVCRKDIFLSTKTAVFENREYKIPSGYDEWLKLLYGNYLELPPKEKQVSHHSFEAYYKE